MRKVIAVLGRFLKAIITHAVRTWNIACLELSDGFGYLSWACQKRSAGQWKSTGLHSLSDSLNIIHLQNQYRLEYRLKFVWQGFGLLFNLSAKWSWKWVRFTSSKHSWPGRTWKEDRPWSNNKLGAEQTDSLVGQSPWQPLCQEHQMWVRLIGTVVGHLVHKQCRNNNNNKIKSVAYSSQESHTGQLDSCNWLADGSTTV